MKTILILAVTLSMFTACNKTDAAAAEKSAAEYAQKVKGATGDISCTQKDSDGDGYVTCTIFMAEGEDRSVECGAQARCWFGDCARGCKIVDTVKFTGGKRR